MTKNVFFVTGTSRGIGLELVKRLCASPDWADLIFASSRKMSSELEAVVKDNPQVKFVDLDVTNEESIKCAAKKVASDLGPNRGVNYLINNAGQIYTKTPETVEMEEMNTILKTNVTGVAIVTKEFAPLLKRAHDNNGEALIVNFSSAVGSLAITDSPSNFVYRLSKSAVNMLSKTSSIYFKKDGIKLFAYHPGWVLTEMGGPNALKTTEVSANECLQVVRSFKSEWEGQLVNYEGKILPW